MNNTDLPSFSESGISYQNHSPIENTNYADILFKVKYETQTGQEVRVSGGIEELGFWEPEKGLKMATSPKLYPYWCSTQAITCPVEMEFKYKYLVFDSNTKQSIWESNMPNRSFKVELYGKLEIQEEKGNNQRQINQLSKINGNENDYSIGNNNKTPIDFSPINSENVFIGRDGADNEIELRGSLTSFYTENKQLNMRDIELLNYDKVKIEAMQNNPLTIGLKRQIEINPEEDKFIILTALLPFKVIKNNNNENNNNINNINEKEKYSIIPKYEDELYESLFRIRENMKYEIYWIGMLDNYENFYDDNENFDTELIEFLKNKKIYIIVPEKNDYINYWIYVSHIIGNIFYNDKIPVNDDYFMNYDKYWESYKLINELFATTVFKESKSSGLIMVHDINLSLVPHYISQKNNYAKIGFYFHSLFPSLEVLKSLPFHQELIQSIMLCDLICFHHIEIAMKFLGAIQRILDLYNEVKPGGNIIINYQGRIVHIHIMQIGIDLENINMYLKSNEFLNKKENLKKLYKFNMNKNNDDNNNKKIGDINSNLNKDKNKDEKEKYIFFSVDGLSDRNKILIKFQSFDYFYKSYLKKINCIKNNENKNMDKIIEENEEYINSCKSIIEVKPGVTNLNSNITNINKNLIDNNNNNLNINTNSEIKQDISTNTINNNIEKQPEDKKIQDKSKIVKNTNNNVNNDIEIVKKKTKKIKIKKGKAKKNKSKSGINLSHTSKDIQIDQKLNKEINENCINTEPIFIQILKDSESKIMNIYNYKDETQIKDMEKNYNDILNLANEINKKYNKVIIIVKREPNFSIIDLYSLYSIGDCYYSLRKDYNSSIQIQSYIYICNYLNKTYEIILNENSSLSPGIKGVKKVNDFDILQNILALEKAFFFNYINKYMNENNIKFINNNQIKNWSKKFFSKLKKVSFNENNCQKIVIGLGLDFFLMKVSRDFTHLNKIQFNKDYHESNKNLIFLDYETIIQLFNKENKEQKENVLSQLKLLSSQDKNKIYIISGCKKMLLDEVFGGITNIGLASEYGFFYKKPGENELQNEYHQLFKMKDWSWKKGILPILKSFTERTEGSYIIEKESILSWVYKNCDPDFGLIQANEMISHIKGLLFQNDSIIVADENDAVNIRPKNVNKGYFISEILKQEYKNGEFPEFILAIGDQDGDEEMFKYLNYLKNYFEIKSKIFSIYTVTIGKRVSNANYFLNVHNEILEYLENLNKEYKNDGNSFSKFSQSQELYNLVEQSDEYELYSKKDQSLYDL